jgi:transposase
LYFGVVERFGLGSLKPWHSKFTTPIFCQNPNSCVGLEPVSASLGTADTKKEKKALMSSPSPAINIGIDVSKEKLDIAVYETDTHWTSNHDCSEFPKLVEALRALTPNRIIIEASGGLEQLLVSYLAVASLPVIVLNPRQVRDFARATGQLAKTDRLDAFVLARLGASLQPAVRPLKSAETQALEALVNRRAQLVEMLTAERLRLQQAQQQRRQAIVRDLKAHIKWLEKRLNQCEADLSQRLRASPLWRETDRRLQSVPGVGPITSLVLIAELPELGHLPDKQLVALCGLAPHARDSGKWHGKRTTRGGRARVRTALYMATLVATKHNLVIKTFYCRLLRSGKEKKVALTACMRKLLVILNAMFRHQTSWQQPSGLTPGP